MGTSSLTRVTGAFALSADPVNRRSGTTVAPRHHRHPGAPGNRGMGIPPLTWVTTATEASKATYTTRYPPNLENPGDRTSGHPRRRGQTGEKDINISV